jgi:16S rRNA (guanine966-N2)-methyltransferase
MLRIISGRAGGCRLHVPRGSRTRPTSDRVKEALFNILPSVEGKKFLDLFAGTGSVGLEALSRGARETVLVEKDPLMIESIRKNMVRCGLESGCLLLGVPFEKAVRILEKREDRFDVIFADPPYGLQFPERVVRRLEPGTLALPDAVLIIQHAVREAVPETGILAMEDCRKYGDTEISIFRFREVNNNKANG